MNTETIARSNLKTIVRAYRKATGQSLPAVSKQVYGHVGFLQAFFDKKQGITFAKFDHIISHLRESWPDGAEWPHLDSIIFDPPEKRNGG